jgi:hypothetical protein
MPIRGGKSGVRVQYQTNPVGQSVTLESWGGETDGGKIGDWGERAVDGWVDGWLKDRQTRSPHITQLY